MNKTDKATAQFTEQQIDDWEAYEEVRSGGAYNMFDPRARRSTGLSGDEYSFVMKHYSALRNLSALRKGKEQE